MPDYVIRDRGMFAEAVRDWQRNGVQVDWTAPVLPPDSEPTPAIRPTLTWLELFMAEDD